MRFARPLPSDQCLGSVRSYALLSVSFERLKHHFLTDKEKQPKSIKSLDGLPAKCLLPRRSQT